jgi:HEAT repeat protein
VNKSLACALLVCVSMAIRCWAVTEAECNKMLETALSDKNPDTRKAAVAALSLTATNAPALARLEGMLHDQDVIVRQTVVAGLAELKTPEARAALRKALDDAVPEVSFAAAKALWALHDPAGEQALLAVLGRESKTASGFLTTQKREALRMMHTPRTLFFYVVRQGVGFAPVPGLGEGITSMQALLTDPGTSGRATAALLLAKDDSPAARDALEDALLDKDWSVRAAAVHSLALRNDPAMRKDIEPLLEDKKEAVRLRAAAAYLRLSELPKPAPTRAKPHR